MKFHCKNELSLLSFDEAVVKEFKIEKDTIQMQFSGGVVKVSAFISTTIRVISRS